jgi:hypothetical protein
MQEQIIKMCTQQHAAELCNHGWISFMNHRETWFYNYKMFIIMSTEFNVEWKLNISNIKQEILTPTVHNRETFWKWYQYNEMCIQNLCRLLWTIMLYFCLNFMLQMEHWNRGSTPHSQWMWRLREVECLNERPQRWHTYKFSSFDGLVQLCVMLVSPPLNIPYSPEKRGKVWTC